MYPPLWSFDWRYFVFWPFDGLVKLKESLKSKITPPPQKKKNQKKKLDDFLTQKKLID
jgi:hypothetical protein